VYTSVALYMYKPQILANNAEMVPDSTLSFGITLLLINSIVVPMKPTGDTLSLFINCLVKVT
jgi:hypothetical protein